ncbi:MAG: oxygen-independent coproporphyrinogen III oxidase-like protein [Limnobacter sp.]|nr:oxygen-independent coproporphyrinogen III oxidase-like protein [Limnobacter sp.]
MPVSPSNTAPAHRTNTPTNASTHAVARVQAPGEISLSALPPLGLYIHLPWCVRKCPYCDFNSHVAPHSTHRSIVPVNAHTESLPLELQQQYIHALVLDLDAQLPKVWGRRLHSVFIGGGTPSLFAPSEIDRLLGEVRARLGVPVSGEITLEANPGTFEQARFEGFKAAGVTRLSVGVQSFNNSHLQALGRVHSAEQAQQAVATAVALFDEVNLDLMYGLPGQTPQQALCDLEQALSLNTTHLSLYQLTIEPNTRFAAKPPVLPSEDHLFDIEQAVHARAAQAGFFRYEISAFCKPGHACQHNLNYWRFGDYLGIGAGAHAKISYANRIERETRHKNPAAYMQQQLHGQAAPLESRALKVKELPFEFMLNALRLLEGVPEAYFQERCGRPFQDISKVLHTLQEQGLIVHQNGAIRPSAQGVLHLNSVLEKFL